MKTRSVLRIVASLVSVLLMVSVEARHLIAQSTSGLVSVWAAEGDATDSFDGNDGILVNGKGFTLGGAFHFDGIDDMVVVPDDSSLRPNQVSVAAWVKFDNLESTRYGGAIGCCPGLQYIVFKRNSRTGLFEGYTLFKNRRPDNLDYFGFEVTSADGTKGGTGSSTSVKVGQWYHIVGTYDGQYSRIYINGLRESQHYHGLPLDHSTQPLVIGRTGEDGEDGEANFDAALAGAADDIRVYSRALSDDEVYDLFAAGRKQRIEGLAAFVIAFNLQQGIENSLDAKLDAALNALDDLNENNDQAACNSLQSFINAVEAQRDNKITSSDADVLIEKANAITQLICPQ